MSSTLIYQYLNETSVTVTVPSGYSSNVMVYAWGGGGGAGVSGVSGGGAGFVSGNIIAHSGDTITVSVAGAGGSGSTGPGGLGGLGNNPYVGLNGSNSNDTQGYGSDNENTGSGGGGGGASSISVNGISMLVAAGGGGGAGGRTYQAGPAGDPGGIQNNPGSGIIGPYGTNYATGGGGGGGIPAGQNGFSAGDDYVCGGGQGGHNYANVNVRLTVIESGSGVAPGGLTNPFYPKSKRGYAGYNGAVILVFTKTFTSWIKDAGDWKLINRAWVKTAQESIIGKRTVTVPAGSVYSTDTKNTTYGTPGTYYWTVPTGVTSVSVTAVGGGGSGGLWRYVTSSKGTLTYTYGGGGGGSGGISTGTLAVTPGSKLTITVGPGGTATGIASASVKGIYVTSTTVGRPGQDSSITNTVGDSITGLGGLQGADALGTNGGVGAPAVTGGVGGTNGGSSTGGVGGDNGSGWGVGGNGQSSTAALVPLQGTSGAIVLNYTQTIIYPSTTTREETYPIITVPGGWKEIVKGWIKQNGRWRLIETPNPLAPNLSRSVPIGYTTINIVISANTNNYNLADYLSGYGYNPGHSIINLIVNSGIVVGSDTSGTPALNITGLTAGDIVNVINNGSIIGKGGRGGAAGSYTAVTTSGYYATAQNCFLPGTLVSTPNGYVTIETIQVGDLVYAYNIGLEFNNSIALEPKTVTKTYTHTWETANHVTPLLIITHSQGELIVTPEHELLCLDKVDPNSDYPGFVRADGLAVGDIIYAEDGSELTVTNISNGPEHYEYVYNLEVDDFHTYVAGGVRVHNGQTTPAPKGGYTQGTTTINSVPGRQGENGGPALYTTYNITLANNGIIAGGGGGGGGGGGPTGGQGGGGAGAVVGSGANNGTSTAGGAGAGLGGAGGARGTAGSAGTNENNAGGVGGEAGIAIIGYDKVTLNVEGTILGPRNVA